MQAWRRFVRDLSYVAHGGSGYAHGYRDILEMDAYDAFRWVEMLEDAREETARAMKRAQQTAQR